MLPKGWNYCKKYYMNSILQYFRMSELFYLEINVKTPHYSITITSSTTNQLESLRTDDLVLLKLNLYLDMKLIGNKRPTFLPATHFAI